MKHLLTIIWLALLATGCAEKETSRPNIILLYLDDLGYGDVGAYGDGPTITPQMDRLAAGGLRFTRGYAAAATCTPSRYALLTGRYPWRNRDARVLPGTAPLIIDTLQATLPRLLRSAGYRTAVVGKWHLGLGTGEIDWNKPISPGPNQLGFDESYILAATQDRVPTVYLHNGTVVGLDPADPIFVDYRQNFPGEPTGRDHPEQLTMRWHHGHDNSIVNGISRIGFMKGGKNARWSDVDMADHFLERTLMWIARPSEQPFFLYYALQQPHVPRTPHPRFVGRTGMGPRGDAIAEADACIGRLLDTLAEKGLLENTLLILTSDNGPVLNDGYFDDAVELLGSHRPAGPFRGGKYSLFEAGTRVPFIVHWAGRIRPGVSDAMISQTDLLATLAECLSLPLPQGLDSQPLAAALTGESRQGRTGMVLEASGKTAYREGNWSLIPPYPGPAVHQPVNIESGNGEGYQLYDLSMDSGQQRNLADSLPAVLEALRQRYEAALADPAAAPAVQR
ncbi:MAG: hypothetical protein RLY31_3002 [Bacteroidota bacterium]